MRFQKYRDQCGLRPKAWFRRHTFLVPNLIEPNFDFGANLIQTAHRVSTLPNLTLLPHQTKTAFSAFASYSFRQTNFKDFSWISRTNYSFSRTKIFSINRHSLTRVWIGGRGGTNVICQLKFWPFVSYQLNFRLSVSCQLNDF